MKRELDPFESKLKEKLQGKATFPEDILWKRLNDELLRSDQHVVSKNRVWILGAALLVFISLGTGYYIGVRQEASRQITSNSILSGTKLNSQKNTAYASRNARTNGNLTSVEETRFPDAKQINKIHRGYGEGYPEEILLKWSEKADEWMKNVLRNLNHLQSNSAQKP
jgi:hypothetical protein